MYKAKLLNYDYDLLEPFIDTHTMGLHYNKHYLGYLNRLNKLLKKNNFNFKYDKKELIFHLNDFNKEDIENILFNLGGVLNHELYFSIISSKKNNEPIGNLKAMIEKKYGSYDNFKEQFENKALKLKGSGYTFLVLDSNNNLEIINVVNQITPYLYRYIPIITLDMWEHAYYLNYKNNKKEYIDNFFEVLDYDIINKIYEEKKTNLFI